MRGVSFAVAEFAVVEEPHTDQDVVARERQNVPPSDVARPKQGRSSRSWRPNAWLATAGTLVAIATGMVSLRNEISPPRDDNVIASPGAYEQSVGDVCEDLNRAESRANEMRNEWRDDYGAPIPRFSSATRYLTATTKSASDRNICSVASEALRFHPRAARFTPRPHWCGTTS